MYILIIIVLESVIIKKTKIHLVYISILVGF